MSKIYRFDDEYLNDFFQKRKQLNELKFEVDSTSKEIKEILRKNGMIYAATENFTLDIYYQHKVSDKFILLLKENKMNEYIDETCSMKNMEYASTLLNVDPSDYKEIRYEILKIRKK